MLYFTHPGNLIALRFSDAFRGYKDRTLGTNGFTNSCIMLKNGQTYFKNLALFKPQDILIVWPFCNVSVYYKLRENRIDI